MTPTHEEGERRAPTPQELDELSRLAYGSLGLALAGIVLLSGALGSGVVVRAVGGTLATLSIVGMVLAVISSVHPVLLRIFATDRADEPR